MKPSLIVILSCIFSLSLAQNPSGKYEKVSVQLDEGNYPENVVDAVRVMRPEIINMGFALEMTLEKRSKGGAHVTLGQFFDGIPVYNAGIKANLNRSYRMTSLLDNLCNAAPSGQIIFSKTEEEASAFIIEHYQTKPELFTVEKCLYLKEDQLVPAFKTELSENPYRYEIVLDADNFGELQKTEMGSYHRMTGGTDTTGTGVVFNPDPITTAGTVYGGNYKDFSDADITELNAERQVVTLKDITWNGVAFTLTGPYVVVKDTENPVVPVVTSTNGDFTYTRAESGFEDVMVYYHIDTFQRYIQSLGFNNLGNFQIIADPHGFNGADNSHFVPMGGGLVRVAFGEGGVDDAEDADVIIHEYGHALCYDGSPGTNNGTERQGLDEGTGDYLAASYSRSIDNYAWEAIFTWDGHNEFWSGRNAASTLTYPPGSSNIYTYGELWASTLMEVQLNIGRTASDENVFESLFSLFSGMTLTDASFLIIDADSALHGGVNYAAYQEEFCNRGIWDGVSPNQTCTVSSDVAMLEIASVSVYPNPSAGKFEVILENAKSEDALSWSLRTVEGRELAAGKLGSVVTEFDLSSYESGVYFLEIMDGNGGKMNKKIISLPKD